MFKCVSDVSNIYHSMIDSFIKEGNIAIDATLGNGYDADYLSSRFQKVYAFDIQQVAVKNYNTKQNLNVTAICDSHENFKDYINEEVDCIIYNLGYLPGESKNITTETSSTLKSISVGLELLNNNGLMFIALYSGHEEGKKEKEAVLEYCSNLPKNKYGVLYQQFINRHKNPPSLLVIEKK